MAAREDGLEVTDEILQAAARGCVAAGLADAAAAVVATASTEAASDKVVSLVVRCGPDRRPCVCVWVCAHWHCLLPSHLFSDSLVLTAQGWAEPAIGGLALRLDKAVADADYATALEVLRSMQSVSPSYGSLIPTTTLRVMDEWISAAGEPVDDAETTADDAETADDDGEAGEAAEAGGDDAVVVESQPPQHAEIATVLADLRAAGVTWVEEEKVDTTDTEGAAQ